MPELPEVEAARRAIEEHCIGKTIVRAVIADDPKVIVGVSPNNFEASLVGKTIVTALRKGKNMWLQLDSPPFPSFHFGMTGAIYIKGVAVTKYKRSIGKETDEWPSKYSKFFIELNDGLEISFTDPRRFAKVRLLEDPSSVPPICALGPDALLEPMTVDEWRNSLSKKNIGIKALLLNQGFISGIGNWIADEVLYQARIHPLQISSALSKESCILSHKYVKEVIQKAVEVGAESSLFPSDWIFHSRQKSGKAFVDGKKIEFITAGGRTTAYVPELQKLSGSQVTLGKPNKRSTRKNYDGNTDTVEGELKSEENEEKTGKRTSRKGYTKLTGKKKKNRTGNNSDSDAEDDNGGENQKKGKNPASKRKARGTI